MNPPVQERRYHWIRWNQPTDLLRLSAWLKAAHHGIDVRLFDFMLPDRTGHVPKHKVKETWTGSDDDAQLWHFGQPFDVFNRTLARLNDERWTPDVVIVSSLTSYWHVSIEKLLIKLCTQLGRARREGYDHLSVRQLSDIRACACGEPAGCRRGIHGRHRYIWTLS